MIAYIPITILAVIFLIAVYCIIERQKVIALLVATYLPGYHLVKDRKKAKRAKKVSKSKETVTMDKKGDEVFP